MADKRRLIEEAIAACYGRGGYHDIREGIGTSPAKLTTQDVAAALGVVKTRCGDLAAKVLETRYAGVQTHVEAIARAWDSGCPRLADKEQKQLRRMAAQLAARDYATGGDAGIKTTDTTTLAWILVTGRSNLDRAILDVRDWLSEIHHEALGEFRNALREKSLRRQAKAA